MRQRPAASRRLRGRLPSPDTVRRRVSGTRTRTHRSMATTDERAAGRETPALSAVEPWGADRVPAPVLDGAVAAATAAIAVLLLLTADEPQARAPDAPGYLLLVAASVPPVWRRAAPAAMLAATSVLALAYLTAGYPGAPMTVPVLVALYGAAAAGRRRLALLIVGLFAGVGSVHRLVVQDEIFVEVAFHALLFVFSWLLGELVASRRALRGEVEQRLRRASEEREREAHRRVQQERVLIARELHDVMAHTVSSMTVQAGVAADLLDDRPQDARAALQELRRAGRDAMGELRATVNLLRGGDRAGGPPAPAPGLSDLPDLLDRVDREGLTVESRTIGTPRALPAAVELTTYRIVQEALTNVLRHAGAGRAVVSLRYEPDALTVEIGDDGRGAAGRHVHSGFGLLGMRERAAALGGHLKAGPGDDGGFCVRAWLPTREEAR